MSGFRVVWEGLDELRAQLRAMPAELAAEGGGIVDGAADVAHAEILAAYERHRYSGDLAAHVTRGRGTAVGRFGASTIIKSNAAHAWLFENGSQARHYITKNGVRHLTGRMPPANIFVPITQRRRRGMYDALAAMLERHGLRVTGKAA